MHIVRCTYLYFFVYYIKCVYIRLFKSRKKIKKYNLSTVNHVAAVYIIVTIYTFGKMDFLRI